MVVDPFIRSFKLAGRPSHNPIASGLTNCPGKDCAMSQAVKANMQDMLTRMEPDLVPATVDVGNPVMAFCELVSTGGIETGVWSCTAGGWTIASYDVNEAMVMLAGRLRLTASDGTVTEVTEGDLFFIPKGWSGRWDTLEDMQKAYVIVP